MCWSATSRQSVGGIAGVAAVQNLPTSGAHAVSWNYGGVHQVGPLEAFALGDRFASERADPLGEPAGLTGMHDFGALFLRDDPISPGDKAIGTSLSCDTGRSAIHRRVVVGKYLKTVTTRGDRNAESVPSWGICLPRAARLKNFEGHARSAGCACSGAATPSRGRRCVRAAGRCPAR
jgi:sulfopropanediol 3-dehydrogenase